MVARDNRLMGNMQSPTQPPPPSLLPHPPSSLCGSAFDPPSPFKVSLLAFSSSSSKHRSLSVNALVLLPYLLLRVGSYRARVPESVCVCVCVCVCVFVLFLISHTPSTSSARCQISSLPAVPSLSFSLCYSSHPSSSSPPPRSTLGVVFFLSVFLVKREVWRALRIILIHNNPSLIIVTAFLLVILELKITFYFHQEAESFPAS